ncbi:MAG TPA: alpha/beta fold hydrolase [Thermoanaerobaculia bacterium]|nr:alpha/beta fold hydrolase [Thermoanaerobaculia bacterium]
MSVARAGAAAFLLAVLVAPCLAGNHLPAPAAGDFVIKDFRFASGESLPELRIHYRTLGAPRRDSRGSVVNAALVLHGTTGSGAQFLADNFAGVLFGPGQLLDAARWYLILPDGIGHGGSSKPSDGLHARFPRYGYDDMVTAQYRLLTEGLGVDHLRLVIGTSMGGMHAWVWGEKYPEFMDGLVPLASVPTQIAGRNRMLRKMIIDDIRNDPEWRGGDYERQPRGLAAAVQILVIMTSSPLQWHKAAPTRDAADRFLEDAMRRRLASADANDFLYAFEASRDYDPSPLLERIRVPVLAINSADDLVNPPELGLMENLIRRVRRGRYVLLPVTPETRGHGTHSYPALWQEHLRAFLEMLDADPGIAGVLLPLQTGWHSAVGRTRRIRVGTPRAEQVASPASAGDAP